MRYDNSQLRNLLAGEYVLGTLRGFAFRRFERLVRDDPGMQREVDYWQAHFAPLDQGIEPVNPPVRVWRNIERRLGWRRGLSRFGFWRGIALAGVAAALVLATVSILLPKLQPTGPQYQATLTDQQAHSAWRVRFRPDDKRLQLQAVAPRAIGADKAYELWVLPAGGAAPRSLGLLPLSGSRTLALSPAIAKLLAQSGKIAVSIEPSGGSPTGLPTGPVVYQAQLLRS